MAAQVNIDHPIPTDLFWRTTPAANDPLNPLVDSFGRAITYLRISITDRCNLRCVYCLPAGPIPWQAPEEQLTATEIVEIDSGFAQLGVKQVRLTGGEPLVRPDLLQIVAGLAAIPGIDEISLTTNAMLLEKLAQPLAQAGLTRVNVSLDTLDPEKFRRLTRGGNIDRLWAGVRAAECAGLTPLKFNVVVIKGLNADELPELAALTIEKPWHVRFIEMMPVRNEQDWGPGFPSAGERYCSVEEMQTRLAGLNIEAACAPIGNGPARTFSIPGAEGTLGFISPIGNHFCASCNRMRLTADGCLRPCLLQDTEINVRDALRSGRPLLPYLREAVRIKPGGHEILAGNKPESRWMAQIGG
jgi:GTP 3',8-cyclase